MKLRFALLTVVSFSWGITSLLTQENEIAIVILSVTLVLHAISTILFFSDLGDYQ